jgi:hypothetical protein
MAVQVINGRNYDKRVVRSIGKVEVTTGSVVVTDTDGVIVAIVYTRGRGAIKAGLTVQIKAEGSK